MASVVLSRKLLITGDMYHLMIHASSVSTNDTALIRACRLRGTLRSRRGPALAALCGHRRLRAVVRTGRMTTSRSRCPDIRQERVDLGPQHVGFPAQRVGGGEHVGGRGAGLVGGVADADDVGRYLAGAA